MVSTLRKLIEGIGITEERFMVWVRAFKYVSSPVKSIQEMVEITPKKTKYLADNFQNYVPAILAKPEGGQ